MDDKKVFLRKLQSDPIYHIENIQGTKLENYQAKIINAVSQFDNVVVSSCHDLGKTFVCSRVVLWFASCFPASKVITTAPTFRQVRSLLWSEIRSGFNNSKHPLGGEMLQTEWKIDDNWFALGFSSKKEAGDKAGSNLQGFHAPYILVVIDEAQGVPTDIWTQITGLTTSANVKVLAIGNPLSKGSKYFDATQSSFYKHIKLSCFDSPNLIANGITDKENLIKELDYLKSISNEKKLERLSSYQTSKSYLLSCKWVMQQALELGISHPLFQSKVLGEFPDDDESTLIPLALVEESQNREKHESSWSHFGVDVARFGSDSTVITEINGNKVYEPIKLIQKSNTEVVGRIVQIVQKCTKPRSIAVDSTGLGSGVLDGLVEQRQQGNLPSDIKIFEVHFGAGCKEDADKKRYANLKAKIFFDLRDELTEDLILPGDPVYQQQLPEIKYSLDSRGRVTIESKDEFKKRTGRPSPDEADSLALAVYGKKDYKNKKTFDFDFGPISMTKQSNWT